MVLTGFLSNFFLPLSMVVDPTCDYYQPMELGKIYYAFNKEYESNYQTQQACRWTAGSDPGTRIIVTCNPIDIPDSDNCEREHLVVSLTGNPNFTDAHRYCGSGSFSLVSDENSLTIGLFASQYTKGGKFLCSLTSFLSSQGTTPSPTTIRPKCDCGWKNTPRIVGGTATGINEYPATAALVNFQTRMIFCGATLISKRYAISAAHCNVNKKLDIIGMLVGDWDISKGDDTNAARIYRIATFVSHPQFINLNQGYDIAVVKTKEKMHFGDLVGPACLPFKYTSDTFESRSVAAMGWGTLEFVGPASSVLQYVNLSVLSNAECAQHFLAAGNVILPSQICTFTPGQDACQSDSGGPLYWFDESIRRLQLVGVISYGVGCATSFPGVNTRITSFLDWIISETNDATYCIN